MSLFQVNKAKSAGKVMLPNGDALADKVVSTLAHMADMAGITLGPGGRQVLLERGEINFPPIITKDGVTVIKHLGYDDSIRQLILESARDAALRTASEAGDGTTTATVLSAAIVRLTHKAVAESRANGNHVSPQQIVRHMSELVGVLHNMIQTDYVMSVDGDDYDVKLQRVAELSANGDKQIAKVIIDAFDMVGSEGNMTIVESVGPSNYKIEKINGYTVDIGYEDSLKKFSNGFINDRSGTMIGMVNPVVLLFDGVVNDIAIIYDSLVKIDNYFTLNKVTDKNILLVAHGFSDGVLGDLHTNWTHPDTVNVLPLLTPQRPMANWRTQFLFDLQAYTGAPVFNILDKPLSQLNVETLIGHNLVKNVECSRYRTSIISDEDELLLEGRVDQLKEQLKAPESEYEANDLTVRIGKLTSGIARLYITGPSQGETREKRDRAEDAWMAIRGAIKYGATPGGGFVLSKLSFSLAQLANESEDLSQKMAMEILSEALLDPIKRLYKNYGYNDVDANAIIANLTESEEHTFDLAKHVWVPKYDLLDSASAVMQAIENSVSIASLLGTLGGVVAYNRSNSADEQERQFAREFEANLGGQ